MLDPNVREIYLDALRPPAGYALDRAIATTYSLDLVSLLIAPLAFAMFECAGEQEALTDPVGVLEALRRHSEKITVFCQAGRISVPPADQLLYSYLERMVVEVSPPRGVFHPKVWVLRFQGSSVPLYRMLCLTRNLTFDRSWDTVLVLEGEVQKRYFPKSKPLRDFLAFLPEIAIHGSKDRMKEAINPIAEELRHVDFRPPEQFREVVNYWPLGISRRHTNPIVMNSHSRLLVVSPFLSDDAIERFAGASRETIVISRTESLDQLKLETRNRLRNAFVLDDAGDSEDTENGDAEIDADGAANSLGRLHAKLYIGESGWDATHWTGSANATNSAFGRNVELLIELRGSKSRVGIDRIIPPDDSKEIPSSLRNVLQEYQPPTEPAEIDQTTKTLDETLEAARAEIARTKMTLSVSPGDDDTYSLSVNSLLKSPESPHGVAAKCWPITVPEARAKDPASTTPNPLVFTNLSLQGLTSFLAFEVTARADKQVRRIRFVLNLPIENLPADREDRIVQAIIGDKMRFLRYLLFLLSEGGADATLSALLTIGRDLTRGEDNGWLSGIPLLEYLVRAFARDKDKIKRINRLVQSIRTSPGADEILPEGFDELWQAFVAERKMNGES